MITAFAAIAYGQARPPEEAEDEVRRVLSDYMAAAPGSEPAQLLRFFSRNVHVFTSGGASLGRGFLASRSLPWRRKRSNLIRHVEFVAPGVAVAVGLWRDGGAKPPYDAGLSDYTLVLEDGEWKIATARDGFLQSPDSVPLPPETKVNGDGILSADEAADGWEALFDGKTSAGWIAVSGSKDLPPAWRIDKNCLVTVPGMRPMAIRTRRAYVDFEMTFEWMVSPGGNSGVKYRAYSVALSADGGSGDVDGFEYQVADDDGDPGARVDAKQRSGALYGVTSVRKPAAKPVGEWNGSRLVVAGDHVEHWLNGIETARYAVDIPFASPISLQHHSTEVRFRNLKIRPVGR